MEGLGAIDLQITEYLIVYKRKDDETVGIRTLGKGVYEVNLTMMKKDENCEILGVYELEKRGSDNV